MKKPIFLIFLCLTPALAAGQTATKGVEIAGTISDEAGMPVAEATIELIMLKDIRISDRSGKFTFPGIPPGRYTVTVKRVGFWPVTISDIVIEPGVRRVLDITLRYRFYIMEEIVLTASRIEQRLDNVANNVTVITNDEIEKTPAHDVGEVLNFIPGLVVQKDGGVGASAIPSIRGSEPRHLLVLMDGVPLNTNVEGVVDLAWFPLENVERVELIKGAASAVWGSSLGGALNIITKSPGETTVPKGKIGLSLGRWDTQKGDFSIGGRLGRAGYLISASHTQTDGFRPRTDSDGDNIFVKLNSPLNKWAKAAVSLGYNEGEIGGSEFPDFGFWGLRTYKIRHGSLKLDVQPISGTDISLAFEGIAQDLGQLAFAIDSGDTLSSAEIQESTLGVLLQTTFKLGEKNRLVSGLDLDWADLESENIGGERSIVKTAVFLNDEMELGKWTLSLGARFDRETDFGSQVSPSFGAVYRMPQHGTLLRGMISRDFSSPPPSAKYFEDPRRGILANPDIEAERAWTYQVAVESQPLSFLWAKLALYRSENRNTIDTFVDTTNQTRMLKNFAHRRQQGGELEVSFKLPYGVSLFAGGGFNDVRELPSGSPFFSLTKGEVIQDRPRIIYDIGLDYSNDIGLHVKIKGHYVWWNEPEKWRPDDRKFIWDTKVSQRFGRLSFGKLEGFISVYNFLNTRFARIYLFPAPGRWFEAGMNYRF